MALRLSLVSDTDRPPSLARPAAPKLQQPWVDLVHVAPPAAISGGRVGGPVLERAALEVPQLVRYGGSSVPVQETGEKWHPAQHKIAGGDVQDRSRGRLVQLGGGPIHGPRGRQLELLKGAEKHKTGFHVIGATRPGGSLGGLPLRGRKRHLKNS